MHYTDEEREWIERINKCRCPRCRTPSPHIVFWCGDLIGSHSRLKCDCGCIWDQDYEDQKTLRRSFHDT
jgi:hypothetical protein